MADGAGTTNPSLAGIPVTYTATVAPNLAGAIDPGGTVDFFDNGAPIAACLGVVLTPGVGSATATCPEASLSMTVGSHVITAVFRGDSNFVASDNTAAPFTQTVVQNTTTTTVAGPGGGPFPVGQPVTFTATVTANGAGNQLTPTGTVVFGDSSGTLCSPLS